MLFVSSNRSGYRIDATDSGYRLYIKKFLLGVLVAIGLLFFAYYAHAFSNNESFTAYEKSEYSRYAINVTESVIYKTDPIYFSGVWKSDEKKVYRFDSTTKFECVEYAYKITGLPVKGYSFARNVPTNSSTPKIGGIVKTSESKWGHLAVISDIQDGYLILNEANLDFKGNIFKGRKLKIGDPRIMGYIE